jgi:hypothetical protein
MAGDSSLTARARLDHVMIMVHDLRSASQSFSNLGFHVSPGGRIPGGLENAIVRFGHHGPYLELVSIYQPGGEEIQDNEEFLSEGEGAMYVGLSVDSAADIANHLRDLGLEVAGPTPGTIRSEGMRDPPPVLWRTVVILHGSSPRADPLFFTEYDAAGREHLRRNNPEHVRNYERERNIPHPNGARGFASAWFVTKNLKETTRRYAALGFPRGPEFAVNRLKCSGVELRLNPGSLLLMESTVSDGPLARPLVLHGTELEIPGLSIEVEDLGSARQAMSSNVRERVETVDGPWGKGLVLPPDLSHGVWLALFKPASPGS